MFESFPVLLNISIIYLVNIILFLMFSSVIFIEVLSRFCSPRIAYIFTKFKCSNSNLFLCSSSFSKILCLSYCFYASKNNTSKLCMCFLSLSIT